MFIGCRVGGLVGITVASAVGVGFGVLVGDSVFVGVWVALGWLTVALGRVLAASIITPPLSRLQPLIRYVRIIPRHNPVIKPIVLLLLPIISIMMDHYPYGYHYSQFVSCKFNKLVRFSGGTFATALQASFLLADLI